MKEAVPSLTDVPRWKLSDGEGLEAGECASESEDEDDDELEETRIEIPA